MRHALIALGIFLASTPVSAHDYKLGPIEIGHPWTRATPKGATVAAGYLVIENKGAVADRLVRVSAEVAGRLEIHEMTIKDGISRMRELRRGLEIAPGATARLQPSGSHLMFMNLKHPLRQGARFRSKLVFEKAGSIEVEFVVEAMGASPHRH